MPLIKQRFKVILVGTDKDSKGLLRHAFNIEDLEYKEYSMPFYALSINIEQESAAYNICAYLNEAWEKFQYSPW